jgi:hypothetical protein
VEHGSLAFVNQNNANFLSTTSLFWSVLFVITPPALYFFAEYQTGVLELLLVAFFYVSISMEFFLAIWYSERIAFLWLLRYLFESFAVFARSYRLHFYGLLALGGAISYFFKAFKLMTVT